jgi:threonine/homoserine/homoserine lactone efflux protein
MKIDNIILGCLAGLLVTGFLLITILKDYNEFIEVVKLFGVFFLILSVPLLSFWITEKITKKERREWN